MNTEKLTTISKATHLVCSNCLKPYELDQLHTFATCCNKALLVRYDAVGVSKEVLKNRPATMWRYMEMLPIQNPENIVSLGEGMTPILQLKRLAAQNDFDHIWLKEEGYNPTGSFKARGLSMAISKAKELGVEACIIPTAGNAGGAMSAYCAAAGMKAVVIMPKHTPQIFKEECQYYGAELILVDGLIDKCGQKAAEIKQNSTIFDVSTLKEPYRVEGKKTMGYEIAEQFNWELPDVILYPTGGGTGLIGIWKAFEEMMELGWIKGPLPKMVAVQAENCDPVMQLWRNPGATPSNLRGSIANGLAVPKPFALNLIMKTLEESKGCVVTISEEAMREGVQEIAKKEGLLISPEGAAVWKACLKLKAQNYIKAEDKILLLNTGTGYKYLENLQ